MMVFVLNNERHIVDGIVSVALMKIRTNKIEDSKEHLAKGYYPEWAVNKFIKELQEQLCTKMDTSKDYERVLDKIDELFKGKFVPKQEGVK